MAEIHGPMVEAVLQQLREAVYPSMQVDPARPPEYDDWFFSNSDMWTPTWSLGSWGAFHGRTDFLRVVTVTYHENDSGETELFCSGWLLASKFCPVSKPDLERTILDLLR